MQKGDSYRYDLFVCCAAADLEWVQGFLLPEIGLPAKRLICNQKHVSGSEFFRPGAPISDEFQQAVTVSRFTLLILSPAYFADLWTVHSAQLASYLTVEEQCNTLIPLEKEKSKLPLDIKFRVSLDCTDQGNWKAEAAKLRKLLNQPEPVPSHVDCPYPGMEAFGEIDSSRFFGRDREVQELMERLRLEQFMAVIGPSGCGKSSLVFAGLIPALRKSSLFGSVEWVAKHFRPGENPTSTLSKVLDEDLTELGKSGSNFLFSESSTKRLLLVVDQFEELFTVAKKDLMSFQHALLHLSQNKNCYIVVTVRADFYSYLMGAPIWPQIQMHRLELSPLNEEGLRKAIVQPANDVGVFVQGELLERLVRESSGEQGSLPFLQETLMLLWERLERRFLPITAYENIGKTGRTGLQVAMARRADAALTKLSDDKQIVARRVFLRLVQFGEGRADTRRQQSVAELASVGDASLLDQTLDHLANKKNRLLTLSGEENGAGRKVDIAHEALISGWPTLRAWINERREKEKTRRRLEDKVQEWIRLGGGDGGLLDNVELSEAEQWLHSPDATDLGCSLNLQQLVQRSRKAMEKAEVQKRNRFIFVLIFAGMATTAAIFAFFFWNQSSEQTRTAIARQLAAQSHLLRTEQPHLLELSILLGVESLYRRLSGEASESLTDALALVRRQVASEGMNIPIESVIISPNGKLVAAFANNIELKGLLCIWDYKTAYKINPINRDSEIIAIAWNPDSEKLAVALDHSVEIWPTQGQEPIKVFENQQKVRQIAFSRKGELFAAAYENGTVDIFKTSNWKPFKSLIHSEIDDRPCSISFSQDGESLVTAGMDGVARIWRLSLESAFPIFEFKDHRSLKIVAMSIDGRFLATASWGKVVRLWNLESKKELAKVTHDNIIRAIAFSDDSRFLASASDDQTVRILTTSGLRELASLRHAGAVRCLSFSPNGNFIATAGEDLCVHLWETTTGLEVARMIHNSTVLSVDFHTNGKEVAAGSDDGALIVWDMNARAIDEYRVPHGAAATSITFSDDSKFFAIACGDTEKRSIETTVDNIVKVWNLINKTQHLRLIHEGRVNAICFISNKAVLATLSSHYARLWDLDTGEILKQLSDVETISPDGRYAVKNNEIIIEFATEREVVRSDNKFSRNVIFSANGEYAGYEDDAGISIIKTSENKKIAHWEPGSFNMQQLSSHGIYVTGTEKGIEKSNTLKIIKVLNKNVMMSINNIEYESVTAFSPKDKYFLVADSSGSIMVWQIETSQQMAKFNHGSKILAATYSSDERYVATAGVDGIAKVWEVSSSTELWRERHKGPINSISFNRSGNYIGTASSDKSSSVGLWHPKILIERACANITRNININEWRYYFGDATYENTCKNLKGLDNTEDDGSAKEKNKTFYLSHGSDYFIDTLKMIVENETTNDLKRSILALKIKTEALLEGGDLEGAKQTLKEIFEIMLRMENLEISQNDPEVAAEQVAIHMILSKAIEHAKSGEIQLAYDMLLDFQEKHPTAKIHPDVWNLLCWNGTLYGFAPTVLIACDKAVQLAEIKDKPNYRDSRGLARVLCKDDLGAIEDFEVFVAWAKKRQDVNIGIWSKRERWIKELKAGRNPINSTVLKELKQEETIK